MKIFSGSSNQELAKMIAEIGGYELAPVELGKFENGEKRVRVPKGSGEAVIVQSLSSPVDEQIVEFCLLADAVSRAGYGEITAVVPWLGYSKQDKIFLPGEALSAKVIAQILQTTKMKRLLTFDLHNRAITGFFDLPVVELSARPSFLDYFGKQVAKKQEEWVVVAPDEGAVKASAAFARDLSIPIVYMDKRRDLATGKVTVSGMSGEVGGKRVLIVDDMIVTGGTMMATAKYLKMRGAKSVSVAATHHLYLPGVQEKLEKSGLDEVVVSDTVTPQTQSTNAQILKVKKLKIVSVAQVIVDELKLI